MVPGGSRESLPKRKVRFADQPRGTANGLQISSMSALKLFSPSDIALTEAGLERSRCESGGRLRVELKERLWR